MESRVLRRETVPEQLAHRLHGIKTESTLCYWVVASYPGSFPFSTRKSLGTRAQ